jgi:hypothetical protein
LNQKWNFLFRGCSIGVQPGPQVFFEKRLTAKRYSGFARGALRH